MKVLLINGSPRAKGNTAYALCQMAEVFANQGIETQTIQVGNKDIRGCIACGGCAKTGKCVFDDAVNEAAEAFREADGLVLASPVYFYSINAQLKAVIDRTVARWLEVKNKELYYIVTMADECISSADTTLACFRGYAECVEGAVEKGVIIGSGVCEAGTVRNTPAMAQAYEMGRKV